MTELFKYLSTLPRSICDKDSELRSFLFERSKQYVNKPPAEWPSIEFNWDYRPESQRYCFDGMTQDEFEEYYPRGLSLGKITLEEFDKFLCHFSRRDDDELWEVGCQTKLAQMILYLAGGHPITPPFIKPLPDNEVIFQGGHHRYAVAKAIGIDTIPLYSKPEYVKHLDNFIKIKWV